MRYRGAPIAWVAMAPILTFGGVAAAQHTQIVDAAEQRAPTLVRALLKKGADVNARQPDGCHSLALGGALGRHSCGGRTFARRRGPQCYQRFRCAPPISGRGKRERADDHHPAASPRESQCGAS